MPSCERLIYVQFTTYIQGVMDNLHSQSQQQRCPWVSPMPKEHHEGRKNRGQNKNWQCCIGMSCYGLVLFYGAPLGLYYFLFIYKNF